MAQGKRETTAVRLGRGAWRRFATFSIAFVMVACASQDTRVAVDPDLAAAKRLFSVGYQDITDIYIRDVAVSDLAISGLRNLSTIDPEIKVSQKDGWVVISFADRVAGRIVAPRRGDADAWASLTASALKIAREHSAGLDAAEPEELYQAVFDGMLGQLDTFSRYAGRDEAREHRASRDGFGGIGVRIRLIEDGVRILSVMEDTPAERSGLRDNDVITAIDGEATSGLSQREVVRRLRGPLRSKVSLTVQREKAADPLSIQVVRAHIVPQTVRYVRYGSIAYLRVTGFNQSTTRTLRDKLRQASAEIGPDLAGVVLDLRGNPGGLLDQAVAVSDLFVEHGRIVSTHGRHPDSHQYFDAAPDDLVKNRHVVVLVNGNSASASEIVAAALQDTGRALVVGTASFGKGTVQTVLRLPNEGELTLTWARFHAPSGYALNGRGVMPNVCTAGPIEDTAEVIERLRKGELPLGRSIIRRSVDSNDRESVDAFRAICPPRQTESAVDNEVALRLLESPTLFARAMGGDPALGNTARAAPAQKSLAHSTQ